MKPKEAMEVIMLELRDENGEYYLTNIKDVLKPLNDLVAKAEPMKPIIKHKRRFCGKCEHPLDFDNNFCDECGQAIDWSK